KTLKLIYNLMIDQEIRVYFIRSGIFSKLVSFFLKGTYMSVIVSIFYLISCEHKYISIFKGHPQLVEMLLEKMLQDVAFKSVLYILVTNLASNYSLAKMIVDYNDYGEVIKLAFVENNITLFRLIRNLSCHSDDQLKLSLVGYRESLIELMTSSCEKSSF